MPGITKETLRPVCYGRAFEPARIPNSEWHAVVPMTRRDADSVAADFVVSRASKIGSLAFMIDGALCGRVCLSVCVPCRPNCRASSSRFAPIPVTLLPRYARQLRELQTGWFIVPHRKLNNMRERERERFPVVFLLFLLSIDNDAHSFCACFFQGVCPANSFLWV